MHMRAHAPNVSHTSPFHQQTTATTTYDPLSSIIDFSALLMEFRQRQTQDVNDNSTTTFPSQSMQQQPSAPAIGISRLLELYATIPTGSAPSTHANFLHNFDTITSSSYRDAVQQHQQQHEPQPPQSISSSTSQQNTNIFSELPTTNFQYMSYATQDFPQQPYWFSTSPPRSRPPTTQSPFNLARFGPIALEMLAAIDEAMLFDDYETNIRLAERVGVVQVGVDNIDAVSSVIPRAEMSVDDVCTICLDKMIEKDNECFRKLICGHKYCDGCITQWLAKSKKCPVCNVDLQDKLHQVNSSQT
jgi:hypothetical protein